MNATTSRWNFGNGTQIEARISIGTVLNQNSQRVAISFACARDVYHIDNRIYNVFINAISDTAYKDMSPNLSCSHENVAGGCGNRRGFLSECRCEPLDRLKFPGIRENYENRIIKTLLSKIGNSSNNFHVKLAIFCSGQLLGEQILLFKLLHQLNQSNAKGTIELFLIDHCYAPAISGSTHNDNLSDAVGREGYIQQFLTEICQCLPKDIKVKGTFFSDSKLYIQMAQKDTAFRHHLLVGADIEKANFDMGEVGKKAGSNGNPQPVVLVKTTTNQPAVCKLDNIGNLQDCYDPRNSNAKFSPSQPTTNNNDDLLLTGVAVVGSVALVGFLVLGFLFAASRN
ncbi:MAG: hypothetical protein HKM07_04810 [Chlamydiae bacterium]|nr:hypothetical protein [Chlamydiota bacterium]